MHALLPSTSAVDPTEVAALAHLDHQIDVVHQELNDVFARGDHIDWFYEAVPCSALP